MASRCQLEEAARLLRPMEQGDLDGLCGLYAVVNAVRLVLHPYRQLRRPQLKQLFDRGLLSLSHSRRLRATIAGGINEAALARVRDDVAAEAAAMTYLEVFWLPLFEARAAPPNHEALRAIRHNLREGWPVLVALMDQYDHSSLIVGYSRTRFTLFDSSGHRWVLIRSLSFDPAKPGRPHFVPPASLYALQAF